MTLPSTAPIVIIGGGVMGASTLYHLAKRGLNAVLLEKEPFFGQGATGRCAGGIRYQFATEINIRLSLLSLPMLDRFEEEIGQPIDRRYCGYLFMLTREEDVATFKHNVALQHSLGVMTEWLSGDEVRRRIPLIRCDDAVAGTFNGHDGLCDPNGVVMGYINAARQLGAKAVEGIEVAAIKTAGGKVFGVETKEGDVSADVVVNAAGPWSAPISRTAGIDLPVQPVRRQWLTTTPLPEAPPDFPFVIDFAQSLYFHREGDGLLLGMSNLNEKPGFDQSVDEEFELINLEAATKRMPLLEKAGRASHLAGLYEVTPDAHPIIGRVPALGGYFVVTGFSGHGFMHGPISGLLMSEEILDGKAHTLDISSLRYGRFEEGQLIREYNVI
ncbi:MAG: FAD-binding oxidoreductase [Chloroflexota bacterium]